jgi:hypothetical protein
LGKTRQKHALTAYFDPSDLFYATGVTYITLASGFHENGVTTNGQEMLSD